MCFSLNSCLGGSDNFKHLNEIDLFNNIDPNVSILWILFLLLCPERSAPSDAHLPPFRSKLGAARGGFVSCCMTGGILKASSSDGTRCHPLSHVCGQ